MYTSRVLCLFLVVTIYLVSFNQLVYTVPEDRKAQVTLTLDNPPLTDIVIQVITTDGTAIGEHKISCNNIDLKLFCCQEEA